jgi:toxin ParE1/3/4
VTRLRVSADAENDLAEIVSYLTEHAGSGVAATYAKRIRRTLVRLKEFPRSGAPRHELGNTTRIAVISPYILIYDFEVANDFVIVQRILHGRRDILAELSQKGD